MREEKLELPGGVPSEGGPIRDAAPPRLSRLLPDGSALHDGDNVEHVISYWVMFQAFHSPALAGFAVISHWAPFLLFGVHFGMLADRFDCRKIIQVSQAASIGLSMTWALLFLTGSLQMWHAVVLLILHGLSGTFRAPATQIIIHDIVGTEHLQSAVRMNAIAQYVNLKHGLLSVSTGVCPPTNGLRRPVSYLWGNRFCAGAVDKAIVNNWLRLMLTPSAHHPAGAGRGHRNRRGPLAAQPPSADCWCAEGAVRLLPGEGRRPSASAHHGGRTALKAPSKRRGPLPGDIPHIGSNVCSTVR